MLFRERMDGRGDIWDPRGFLKPECLGK